MRPILLFIGLLSLVLTSCTGFNRTLRKGSFEERMAMADKYYQEEDYYRAGRLYEENMPLIKGRREAAMVEFRFAYTSMRLKNYLLSAYHFLHVFQTYPRDSLAEDANFYYAFSLYKDSPKYNLDPTNTYRAVDAFQKFVNKYPDSQRLAESNKYVDELQEKLERKAYEDCKLYAKIREWKAAVVAIDAFKVGYPDSDYNEELAFLQLQSQVKLAAQSVEVVEKDDQIIYLKRDRYRKAVELYFVFIDSYPTSEDTRAAESLYEQSRRQLTELNKNVI